MTAMLRKLFPHPWLSVALVITWFLLVNHLMVGSLVMAAILAIAIPLVVSAFWTSSVPIRNLPAVLEFGAVVLWDIVVANFTVARLVLFVPNDRMRPAWITFPLDLTLPEAIAVLSATITLTPGTVTAEMSADGRALLVHALHAPDPDAVRDEIKTRYEARLKRIFG